MTKAGFSAIVPADQRIAVNDALESQGYGPDNFSAPAGNGSHALFHCWGTPQSAPFKAYVQSVAATYGITIRDAATSRPVEQVKALANGLSITWPPSQNWLDNLPQTDDVLTFDGVKWRSLIDNNVWSPKAYPQGWELVDKPTGSQPWKQPQGAHDAYPLGAQVTYQGKTWENTGSNANVWAPGVFGWIKV